MEEGAPRGIDSQAGLVQKLVQNQCFLSSCFYDDLGSILGTLLGYDFCEETVKPRC